MIPAVAHFIWYGRGFPWAYALAVMTAARNGGFERVLLHHADPPDDGEGWSAARQEPGVTLVPLDPHATLRAVGAMGPALVGLYDRLQAPAARANVMRAAILYVQGGVYLDTDTLTVKSLAPLRHDAVFAGLEHIALPYTVRRSRNPLRWARAGALLALREGMRRLPVGHRLFAHVAPLYDAAANNAVLGAEREHPFIGGLLRGMVDTPRQRQTVRFALGTNLLQAQLDSGGPGRSAVRLHPPEVFYPLGPEVSEHWFRRRVGLDLDRELHRVVGPATRVIHWYASVRTKHIIPEIDASYLRANARRQLFAAAAMRALTP